MGDGYSLVSQLRPVLHQYAHEEAVHVHVKDHSRLSPTQLPPENRRRAPGLRPRREAGVDKLYRVGAPATGERLGFRPFVQTRLQPRHFGSKSVLETEPRARVNECRKKRYPTTISETTIFKDVTRGVH